MPRITIIGAGYVGLVSAGCFADMGHRVTCVEVDQDKVATLRRGLLPIQEPGLSELWEKHLALGDLAVTADYAQGLEAADFVFVCVGSPSLADGSADIRQVMEAARGIAASIQGRPVVVIKSTVPVGTAARVSQFLNRGRSAQERVPVVSNPEFLSEGRAVQDFLQPDRVIVGAEESQAAEAVASLYRPLDPPFLFCDNATAEMIKYASNAFLATKISFINEIAALCEPLGVDVKRVAQGMGMDQRIGAQFLGAGLGWGGSCLPKDTRALVAMAREHHIAMPLISSVIQVNSSQPHRVVWKLKSLLGPLHGCTVALWGLTFKPDCDDLRESPALNLAQLLTGEGCVVRAYDPAINLKARKPQMEGLEHAGDPYEAVRGAQALVLATAWKEFLSLDMVRVSEEMQGRVVIDARNALDGERLRQLGFIYVGIGRDSVPFKPFDSQQPQGLAYCDGAQDLSSLAAGNKPRQVTP